MWQTIGRKHVVSWRSVHGFLLKTYDSSMNQNFNTEDEWGMKYVSVHLASSFNLKVTKLAMFSNE